MRSIFLKMSVLLIGALFFSLSTQADEPFKENAHYKRVVAAQSKNKKEAGKIDVTEFFLYSCPPCYELEPKMKTWLEKNKDKVNFKRVPAVITPSWVPLAKAYYVAEKLNILEKTHEALFKAIHEDKRVYLNEYKLSEFFAKQGVKPSDFMREFNSKEVVDKVSEARILSAKYAFRGVPAVVLNDEFKTAPFYNKNQEQMLEVMDYLLTKASTPVEQQSSKTVKN